MLLQTPGNCRRHRNFVEDGCAPYRFDNKRYSRITYDHRRGIQMRDSIRNKVSSEVRSRTCMELVLVVLVSEASSVKVCT